MGIFNSPILQFLNSPVLLKNRLSPAVSLLDCRALMTISRTDALAIASRYAAAMFALTEEKGVSSDVAEEFAALADAVRNHEALSAFLKNPLIGRNAKAAALFDLAKKSHALTRQSLETLAEQGRAELLPYVAERFTALVTQAKGELMAEVTSARALSTAVEKQIADALKKATGRPVQLQLKEDPALLGGVKIQLGSLLLDATLAGALDGMRTKLLNATN